MKWDDVKCEEVNSERNEPGSSVVDNDRDDKCEAVTTNDSARDQSYSTENFKIEIFGLPKHTGYGQLKKYLKNLNLEPRKLKMPPGGNLGAMVTFADEVNRQKALVVLNDNCKLKGRVLRATKCKAHEDPYQKAQAKVSLPTSMEEWQEKLMQAVAPMQCLSYEEQLAQKEKKMTSFVKNEIENSILKVNEEIANVIHAQRLRNLDTLQTGPRCQVHPIIASPVHTGYRNKNEFTVGVGPEMAGGDLTVGFRVGSYSDGTLVVVDPSPCKAVDALTLTVAKRFQNFFRQSGYQAFDNLQHTGHWRFLTVRTTQQKHLMIVVSMHVKGLTEEDIEKVKQDLASHCKDDPELTVHSLYFSRVGTSNRETDQKFELVLGDETIEELLNGMKFRISPDSFFQANTKGAEILISTIGSWLLGDESEESVQRLPLVDVCCGTGTIGIALSRRFSNVFGIECVEKAIEDAKKNASLNGVENVEFLCGKAEDLLPNILKQNLRDADSLYAVVDPPRAGLHKRVLQAIRKCEAIKQFIYVSCNPNLAKANILDLARAPTKKGFSGDPFLPKKAVPIDLFPQTQHCELVILFERITSDQIEESNKYMECRDVDVNASAIKTD